MEPAARRRRLEEPPTNSIDEHRFYVPVPGSSATPVSNHFEGRGVSATGSFHARDVYIGNSQLPDRNDAAEPDSNLVERLFFDYMDARLVDLGDAQRTTCEWILQKEAFRACMTGSSSGLLWIKGKPGAGKSVLMKFLYMKAKETVKQKPEVVAISFFFNARGGQLAKSTLGLYRSLLWQLFTKVDGLKERVMDDLDASTVKTIQQSDWSIGSVKHVMAMAMKRLENRTVQLLIDALDECDVDEVKDMLDFLDDMADGASDRGLQLYICFSSRHYPELTMPSDSELMVCELVLEDQEEHKEDIKKYIKKKLQLGKSQRAEKLKSDVLEKSGNIFLWVVLVIRMLNGACRSGRIEKYEDCLKEIPPGLDKLFKKILHRDDTDLELLRRCIQWTLFAKRPLRLDEYFFALRIGCWRLDGDISVDDMRKFVDSSSKGLAEATRTRSKDKMPNVQFIHESVRDFFLLKEGYKYLWPWLEGNFITEGHQHLSERCVDEILKSCNRAATREPRSNSLGGTSDGTSDSRADDSSNKYLVSSSSPVFQQLPFLQYAVQHVLYHENASEHEDMQIEIFFRNFPREHWITLVSLLEQDESRHHEQHQSLVYFCAEGGFLRLLEFELRQGSDTAVRGGLHRYPIFAAIASRDIDVLKTLLASGIRGNIEPHRSLKNHRDQSPLEFAVRGSSVGVVDLLLAAGFEPDLGMGGSPRRQGLSWLLESAAKRRDERILKRLLEHLVSIVTSTIEPASDSFYGGLATCSFGTLRIALREFNFDPRLVRAILRRLENHAQSHFTASEVNFASWLLPVLAYDSSLEIHQYEEALTLAAMLGKADIVRRLLGNHPSRAEDSRHRLMGLACKFGRPQVVKLLLFTGKGDKNAQKHELPALSEYAELIMKLLLGRPDVDINRRGEFHQSPLLVASRFGHAEVVKLLLERSDIDVNLQDEVRQSPLFTASRFGHTEVVKALLERSDIDINLQDKGRRSPLLVASGFGRTELVKLLLERADVDINLQDKFHRSPLWVASMSGYREVVKLLLERTDADVNLQDTTGESPLWIAVSGGCVQVVRLLLDRPDIDLNNGLGLEDRYPLRALDGRMASLKLLLATGKVNSALMDKAFAMMVHRKVGSENPAFLASQT